MYRFIYYDRKSYVYKSVMELPEVPDSAVMVRPTGIVPQVLEECGRKGIKLAIVVSGGFKEVDEGGVILEEKLITIAEQYGTRNFDFSHRSGARRR